MTNQEFRNRLEQILKSNFVYQHLRIKIVDQILDLLKEIKDEQTQTKVLASSPEVPKQGVNVADIGF